jgi:type II secretory pathway component PulF
VTSFTYRAARPDGKLLNGTVEAGSTGAALRQIESRGLFALAVEQDATPRRRQAASRSEVAAMLAGLAALLDAGLPADRAIAALEETASPRLRVALASARAQVREGRSLSAALGDSNAVPPLVVGYLRAGERSGRLAPSAERAAREMERDAETSARIRAALTYPAFLLIAGAVSVTTIVTFVIPRFARLLGQEGRPLPTTTRILLAASSIASHWWPPMLVIGAVAVAALARALNTPHGQLIVQRQLLALPLVGALRHRIASARSAAALAGMIDAGVPILTALDLGRDAAQDRAVGARLAAARTEVERGERLATALRRHAALTPSALRLVAFGEQSGRLAAFLEHAARLESAAAQRAIQRIVTLLEPMLILAFGSVVAFVAAAILQAVYSVRPTGF